MEKGEVWLIALNDVSGHEQAGTRPAVIISDTQTSICIVSPITSNLQALRFGHVISITPSNENGLKEESVTMVFQIRAIDKSRLHKKLGRLDGHSIKKIDEVLKTLLKL